MPGYQFPHGDITSHEKSFQNQQRLTFTTFRYHAKLI